jgi:hypothetical protein
LIEEHRMNRRDFVRTVGGGVVVAAAAGCGPATAELEAAWTNPGAGERDPRRRWAAFAILAPNPHNMQPWLLDLRRPGELLLGIDRERLLPVTDPFNRQIVIGCGAFLELLRMAAAKDGVRATVESFRRANPSRPSTPVRSPESASPAPPRPTRCSRTSWNVARSAPPSRTSRSRPTRSPGSPPRLEFRGWPPTPRPIPSGSRPCGRSPSRAPRSSTTPPPPTARA